MRHHIWMVAFLVLVLCVGPISAVELVEEWGERSDGGYYRVVDLEGKYITSTALEIDKGDSYIDEDNYRYVIDRVDGDTAYARRDGKEPMPLVGANQGAIASLWQWAAGMTQGSKNKTIGIYQTHSAESYKPTSGTESETPRGDIFQVSETLKKALEEKGYNVVYKDDVHLPHDGEAYIRSRRTAADILRDGPATVIDVHRDGVPDPNEYTTTINGEQVSKVRLVVGRQNQNRDANLEYAKRIKAVTDEKYPGLIKGIFNAKGNYNQDMGPRMILLELGTHTTPLEEAQKAAELIADVIPAAAGMAPGTGQEAGNQIGQASMKTVLWLLGISVVGAALWYFINKEGFFRKQRE